MRISSCYIFGHIIGIGLFYVAIPWALIGLHVLTAPLQEP
jgi:hypothetical protein